MHRKLHLRFPHDAIGPAMPSIVTADDALIMKENITTTQLVRRDRIDGFLDLLAVVGILNLELMVSAGTEYGERADYGVTDPLWIGVTLEFLYSVAFFTQFTGILEVLATRYVDAETEKEPNVVAPIRCTVAALVFYHIYRLGMDYCYWHNRFLDIELYHLDQGNWQMYAAGEIPTLLFVVYALARFKHYRDRVLETNR